LKDLEKRSGEERREGRGEKRREEKTGEVVRDTTFVGGRNYISGFQGSQAVPARPSGGGNAYDPNYSFM
jgi:hypothetical protein